MEPYDIATDYQAWMETRVGEKTLQNNLRASTIGFACDRHHYYSLTEYRDPPSWQLKAIFDEGAIHEKDVEEKLRAMGYEVEGSQKNFRIEDPLITIRIDGMLRKNNGPWYAYDAKSINDHDFKQLQAAEDFIHSKKPHQRNYCTQIMAYMYSTNSEYGALVLKNKQNGQIKPIWFHFDTHLTELDDALKRGKRVYAAVAAKTPPDRCEDIDLCMSCDWRSKCLPDLKTAPGVKLVEPDEIVPKLNRLEELKPIKQEYEQLDEEVKGMFKQAGAGDYVAGDWMVRVKEAKRAAYAVKESMYLTTKFVRMN